MPNYLTFNKLQWANLRNSIPLTLTDQDLKPLLGINENISLNEVSNIFLPLVRLINYSVEANIKYHTIIHEFLGKEKTNITFIIGISGSVAVGKSTISRILQALLKKWPRPRQVDLITTDGFLYDLETLKKNDILNKKGFPISYNIKKLIKFLSDVKAGHKNVLSPIYSQIKYDIIKNKFDIVNNPEILILEGLNVLQRNKNPMDKSKNTVFVSDFLNFSIYVDAEEKYLKQWFLKRFLKFKESAFQDPNSYFNHYAKLNEKDATNIALNIWKEINGKNLKENILPTKNLADLILVKGDNHEVQYVKLKNK